MDLLLPNGGGLVALFFFFLIMLVKLKMISKRFSYFDFSFTSCNFKIFLGMDFGEKEKKKKSKISLI